MASFSALSWNVFQDQQSIYPSAFVLTAPLMHGTLLSQFTAGDQMAVLLESSHHSKRPIVLVSCYLPYEGVLTPLAWQGLADFCRQKNYVLVMSYDALVGASQM